MGIPTEPLVVLGIVINSHDSVLLVRRSGETRWIFPGGQSEPGESETETVVREVMEETGIRCEAVSFVGRRTHPESNREMAYWVCNPLSETTMVEDSKEIAEARWVKIEESLDLLGGRIFEPVREILKRSA